MAEETYFVALPFIATDEGVALGGFEVGGDHLCNELVEGGARGPA